MESQDLLIIALAGLAFVVVAGVGFAFAGGESAAAKRAKEFQNRDKNAAREQRRQENRSRQRQTQQMLDNLRNETKQKRQSLMAKDLGAKLQQAGLSIPTSVFWMVSVLLGAAAGTLVFLTGADGFTVNDIELRSQPLVVGAAALAGFLGVPRWVLGMLTKMRAAKMTNQFADAIDIIVRGVKSGLPLNECLQIIGRESPEPLGAEFRDLSSNLQMGNTLEQALNKFYTRVPLPEVNFFMIVLIIQSKSGGNLSEALNNPSGIIRARKMMREKVKALSSEAKASAMIIGCLPFAVATMVYVTTPDYIMELFTNPTGHLILALGATLMFVGITVMRKMINFDI